MLLQQLRILIPITDNLERYIAGKIINMTIKIAFLPSALNILIHKCSVFIYHD